VNGAGMVFVTETIDYGTVAHNSDGKREFVFTNNGNKPLIIYKCARILWLHGSQEPIAPGAKELLGKI
jgi:hypothetical protein